MSTVMPSMSFPPTPLAQSEGGVKQLLVWALWAVLMAALFITYVADGGGYVGVPRSIDPFQELGLSSGASRRETKDAYGARANRPRRQDRVMASLAYHMITSTAEGRYSKRGRLYEIKDRNDQFFLAAVGYTSSLLQRIRSETCSRADEYGRTSLYIAARSGFYDTTKALLEKGAPVNQVQRDGSTPLHGAAYYGQVPVVKLLLSYGADPTHKNKWGNTPADETSVAEIKKLVLEYKEDKIAEFARSFISKGLAIKICNIMDKSGVEIARKIVRNFGSISSMTKREWDNKLSSWESCWHGTRSQYLESILRHGLVPSGTKVGGHTITPPSGHIQLGTDCLGKENWAAAIFVSPSVLYASDACYSELLMSGGASWRVVVRVRVQQNSYSEHSSTLVSKYAPVDGEPENPEYRVASTEEDKIRRVESSRNVIVTSVTFIKVSILEEVSKSRSTYYSDFVAYFGDV